jgi:hypothetical protein
MTEDSKNRKPLYRSRFPYFGLSLTFLLFNIGNYLVFYPDIIALWILLTILTGIYINSWFVCFLKFYDSFLEVSFPTRLWFNKNIIFNYSQIDKIYYSNPSFIGSRSDSYIVIEYNLNDVVRLKRKYLYSDYFIKNIMKILHQIERDKHLK